MVFVAVSIPKLARLEHSFYRASLEGHANNVHCVAAAVNAVFGALFTVCSAGAGPSAAANADPTSVAGAGSDIEDRMKEFLAVSTFLLLKLKLENWFLPITKLSIILKINIICLLKTKIQYHLIIFFVFMIKSSLHHPVCCVLAKKQTVILYVTGNPFTFYLIRYAIFITTLLGGIPLKFTKQNLFQSKAVLVFY